MARWTETKVTLTANQANGIDPIMAAENVAPGNRKAVVIGNPTATVGNLHLTTGQAPGSGLPLPAGNHVAFAGDLPGLDGGLWVTGFAAADKLTIWVS